MEHPENPGDPPVVIAIDGPAASGKSTVARQLSRQLGFLFMNSGDIYRAMTWACLRGEVDCHDEKQMAAMADDTILQIMRDHGDCFPQIKGRDPRPHLRDDAVNSHVSLVAASPAIRALVTSAIRRFAREDDIVIEGRDIGSAVFPETPHKFYIDASPEVRQRRRSNQGQTDEIARRDLLDSTRREAPLTVAAGAVVIDSSDLTIEEVVTLIRGKLRAQGLP